jgi:bacteriorhodopsin
MMKFLINYRSRFVDVVEVLGIIGLATIAWRAIALETGWLTWIFYAIVIIEYAFIRYCATTRWYDDAERFEGVELQFRKAMIPTAYLLCLGSIIFQISPSATILIALAILFAIIAHVNVILIHLHRRDKDSLPPNYFSHHKSSNL